MNVNTDFCYRKIRIVLFHCEEKFTFLSQKTNKKRKKTDKGPPLPLIFFRDYSVFNRIATISINLALEKSDFTWLNTRNLPEKKRNSFIFLCGFGP